MGTGSRLSIPEPYRAARPDPARPALLDLIRRLARPLQPEPVAPATGFAAADHVGSVAGIGGVLFDIYGTLLISAAGDIGSRASAAAKSAAMDAALVDAGVTEAAGLETRSAALVDALEGAIRAAHAAAAKRGVRYPEVDLRTIWRRLLPGASATATARAAVSYECRSNPVWPMPGAAQVVTALQARGPVGIVSNAQFFTPLVLDALLPQISFDPRLTVWSFAMAEAKPAPRLFEAAAAGMARTYGLRPDQLLMVGNDLRNDIWGAQQAGLRGALFAGDGRSLRLRREDARCATLQPELVLTDLAQLPAVLGPRAE